LLGALEPWSLGAVEPWSRQDDKCLELEVFVVRMRYSGRLS